MGTSKFGQIVSRIVPKSWAKMVERSFKSLIRRFKPQSIETLKTIMREPIYQVDVYKRQKQSYCVLVANPKNDTGKKRMQAMCETTDGFVLAEEDLKMRGSGEIFGTRQSGIPEFQVADIVEDYNILEEARRVASQIVSDPNWRENADWQVLGAHLRSQGEFD